MEVGDIDNAHIQWCLFAEACIEIAKGKDEDQVRRLLDASPLRGEPPKFARKMRRKPVDRLGHPTTFQQRQLTNTINRLLEVRNRIKHYAEGDSTSGIWERIEDEELLALLIKLWTDAFRKAVALLGSDKTACAVEGDLPTFAEISKVVDLLRKEHEAIGRAARTRRGGARRAQHNWDWERNHGRLAFQATKVDYSPPHQFIA